MQIDENIDPKPVNDSAEARKKEALIRENENRLRQEGAKKAVVNDFNYWICSPVDCRFYCFFAL